MQSEELLVRHRYAVIRKVGQGSFGKAVLVEKGGSQYICKSVDLSVASKARGEAALAESRLLSSLRHPCIVRHRETFCDQKSICIVMDYCEGGDLASRIGLMWRRRRFFDEEQVVAWISQTLLALQYIHAKNIVHRDVKPGNLFLSKNGDLQLGDFGVAKILASHGDPAMAPVGTPYYLSPEVCLGRQSVSCASDIWSLGCVLHELCTLHVPFEATGMSELMEKICNEAIPIFTGYSEGVQKLYRRMLNRNPEKRGTASDALQSSVLQPFLDLQDMKGGVKRTLSPSFAQPRSCTLVRRRIDNVVGALAKPERLAPSDFLSRDEVASRLLGRPMAWHDAK